MHEFQDWLQSFLVVCTLLSEYVLIFDAWIVTAPVPAPGRREVNDTSPQPTPSPGRMKRRRWVAALRTAVVYAVSEPMWYLFMGAVSSNAVWWVLMASYVHIAAVPGSIRLMASGVEELMKQHKEMCLSGTGTTLSNVPAESREGPRDESLSDDDDENEDDEEAQRPSPPVSDALGCGKHPIPPYIRLTPLYPAVSAAAANAALVMYTRFLHSKNSREWIERFEFGWTAVALVVVLCVGISKSVNRMMQTFLRRRVLDVGSWELGQRLVCLVVVNVVRASLYGLFGLPPFATAAARGDGGAGIILEGGVEEEGEGVIAPGGGNRPFDRLLAHVPWWASLLPWVTALGPLAVKLYRSRRHRRRAEEASQR